jgi:hypothetical protein
MSFLASQWKLNEAVITGKSETAISGWIREWPEMKTIKFQ